MARRRVSLAAHAPGALHPHLPAIKDDKGEIRPLGRVPDRSRKLLKAVAPYRDTTTLIPEKDWEEFNEWPHDVILIKNQDSKGACNGHAAATGVEISRYVSGMDHVPISAWFIYSILCNGVDQGSMIGDALQLVESKGAAPESDVDYGLINPKKLTDQSYKDALRYKAEIGNSVASYEEIGTAVVRRQPINLSITVGANFNNLDSDGVPPLGRGPGNHAVFCGLGLKRRTNGEVLILMANSWGTDWGVDGGFCWLPLKKVVAGSYFEAYTLSAVIDDTADTTRPPKGHA